MSAPRSTARRLLLALRPYLVTLGLAAPLALALWLIFRAAPGLRFARPWALLLLGGVALAAWVLFHVERRRAGTFLFSRVGHLHKARPGWRTHLHALPRAMRVVAVALVALALARPQSTLGDDEIEFEGIDIMLVLDLSHSMEETDLQPDRLTAAKQVIDRFIARRKNDRIGMVVFGKDAYTLAPLTLDYGALRQMIAELKLGMIDGHGTAIGQGLAVALNRLRRSDAQSKVAIIVTDGDNNAGNVAPLQSAAFADRLGVKVFTILVGDNAPDSPSRTREGGRPRRRYPVNPKLLEALAAQTGGVPYLATDTAALEQRFHQILEELDRSKWKERTQTHAELYRRFLWPALVLLFAELVLGLTLFRKLP